MLDFTGAQKRRIGAAHVIFSRSRWRDAAVLLLQRQPIAMVSSSLVSELDDQFCVIHRDIQFH